jgi:hypothetical protein
MRELKFRQYHLGEWHHWGYINGTFFGPLYVLNNPGEFIESQQYTGLKDKNGKEIYEGDIIDFENGYKDIIEFYSGCFKLQQGGYQDDLRHGLVIGNIYENPDLI